MTLTKISQSLWGKKNHYILLNLFNIVKHKELTDAFILDFFNSDHFLVDAQADFKMDMSAVERNQYLPFPYRTEQLMMDDFIIHRSSYPSTIIKSIKLEYHNQFSILNYDRTFDEGIQQSLSYLSEALSGWASDADFYLLSMDRYDHKSTTIHPTYNELGFIHAYHYYLVAIYLPKNELVAAEIGYE